MSLGSEPLECRLQDLSMTPSSLSRTIPLSLSLRKRLRNHPVTRPSSSVTMNWPTFCHWSQISQWQSVRRAPLRATKHHVLCTQLVVPWIGWSSAFRLHLRRAQAQARGSFWIRHLTPLAPATPHTRQLLGWVCSAATMDLIQRGAGSVLQGS